MRRVVNLLELADHVAARVLRGALVERIEIELEVLGRLGQSERVESAVSRHASIEPRRSFGARTPELSFRTRSKVSHCVVPRSLREMRPSWRVKKFPKHQARPTSSSVRRTIFFGAAAFLAGAAFFAGAVFFTAVFVAGAFVLNMVRGFGSSRYAVAVRSGRQPIQFLPPLRVTVHEPSNSTIKIMDPNLKKYHEKIRRAFPARRFSSQKDTLKRRATKRRATKRKQMADQRR